MRDTTERPEGIAAGTLKLVGTTEAVIYKTSKSCWKIGKAITLWHMQLILMVMVKLVDVLQIF